MHHGGMVIRTVLSCFWFLSARPRPGSTVKDRRSHVDEWHSGPGGFVGGSARIVGVRGPTASLFSAASRPCRRFGANRRRSRPDGVVVFGGFAALSAFWCESSPFTARRRRCFRWLRANRCSSGQGCRKFAALDRPMGHAPPLD